MKKLIIGNLVIVVLLVLEYRLQKELNAEVNANPTFRTESLSTPNPHLGVPIPLLSTVAPY